MPEYMISDVPVNFPFEPYDVQKRYMEKVIDCIENGRNGLLESPTGTGKTLSLLCSSLGWLLVKKTKVREFYEMDTGAGVDGNDDYYSKALEKYRMGINNGVAGGGGAGGVSNSDNSSTVNNRSWGVPKIIYASRTHTQLTQAMKELKRTFYNGKIKTAVIASRDQLCIHPDVAKEQLNANKIQLCKLKVATRTCSFYHRVESKRDDPQIKDTMLDIEDLVRIGQKLKCCPFYTSRNLLEDADIIFMPYNYLLDPKARRANKIDLNNTIIILDEAHNVEKMCEESVSIQLCSSEIAVCIDDLTNVMKAIELNPNDMDSDNGPKDFTLDDLVVLKELILELEKVIDEIEIAKGSTYPGSYMFEILEKAKISNFNYNIIVRLLDSLIQYLTGIGENNPMFRRGGSFQKLFDLLTIVFSVDSANYKEKVSRCFKVHIELEEQPTNKSRQATLLENGWIQPRGSTNTIKTTAKKINYWCFNPGFGMEQLTEKNVRCIILTSGTLAPLQPLISELDIKIDVTLENPHIVNNSQVCVKIISQGPDKVPLNSNYENRSNVSYMNSLGRTILSFSPVIPGGLLIFFPSYYLMNSCKDTWQASGIWSQIQNIKTIFIESTIKDAFVETMAQYYKTIQDSTKKGAIFMAVCRGKVSEGLDFSDIYGRAVIITGLPFPPFKDPRIILKKQYLQDNRTKQNQLLTGDEWYFLEATRTINQAIGRVIRHRYDYGAILLCDQRFNNPRIKQKLSKWIQTHLNSQQQHPLFGPSIRDVSQFFRNAERTLPQPSLKPLTDLLESSIIKEEPLEIDNSYQRNNSIGPIKQRLQSFHTATKTKIPVKIEDANSVLDWDPTMYANAVNYTPPSKKAADFFSGLNEQVNTIDFNNLSTSSSTDSLVTIHKRNRYSPSNSMDMASSSISKSNEPVKRRKYKLVANNQGNDQFLNGSTAVNCGVDSTTISSTSTEQPTTEDRKELLQLIKSVIPNDQYSILIKSVLQYHRSPESFNELFDIMKRFLNIPQFHYLLKRMKSFLKRDEDKRIFENFLNEL